MATLGIVGTTLEGIDGMRYENVRYYDANYAFACADNYTLNATTIKRLAKKEGVELKEVYDKIGFYVADSQRFGKVFGVFTGLAIFVACLGLFGLASFTTLQRTREIGIRKVMGASVLGILKLLYKEFALLLLWAFVISIPIAWLTSLNWLQAYAFRINLHWMFFVLPFLGILFIAFVTVSIQTLRASLANPVISLRSE